MRTILWLSATLTLLSSSFTTAVADDNEEPRLGTVVVTATRTEQPIEQATTSISVITDDEIHSREATEVIEMLRDVPGVNITQSGSTGTSASLFIRGADADQTLTLLDGVEVNSPTLGEFNFANLTTDNLDRIEVLRGSGGTLYGSEAVGGVVSVFTKRGEGAPHVSLLGEGGNGDTQRYLTSFSGAHGAVGVSGSVSYTSTAGFEPVNDDYTLLTSSLRLDADLVERGTLRGFFRYQDAVVGLVNNTNFLSIPDPNARMSDELYLFKGEWEHQPFDSLRYRVAGYVVHDSETFTDPDADGMSTFSLLSRIPTQINCGEGQANYYVGRVGITTAGFQFQEREARPKSLDVPFGGGPATESHYNASRSIYSGYLLQQLLFFDEHLIGSGGFRVDADEGFGTEVSPSWSVGYLQDWDGTGRWGTRVKGSYAEGFRAPTFNELFFPNAGNPNLDAETSSEYDGGVVQSLWGELLRVDATYFNRRTKNLIQFVPTCSGVVVMPGFFVACNVGRADVSGVETGVSVEPLPGLSLRGNYTYLDFHVVGAMGQPGTLLRRPHNTMSTVVRYRHAAILQTNDDLDLTSNVNFVGDRSDFNPTTFEIVDNPNYTVTGAAATYSFSVDAPWIKRMAVFTRINNMFNRNYQQALGFQSPPINFVVGGRVSF